jgi:hypothetical protein
MYKYKFSKVGENSARQKMKIDIFYSIIQNLNYFREFIIIYLSDFGFLTPYFERP